MQIIDSIGHKTSLCNIPQRIISLVPSQTELLFHLGLNERVIGITKFCIHPVSWQKSKTIVGGTKNIDIEKIISLSPDLIIANKEENSFEDIQKLQMRFPVYVSDITTIEEATQMIFSVGKITGFNQQAIEIIDKINRQFTSLNTLINKPSVAYLIWKNPYMAAANHTFIHSILSLFGFDNVFSDCHRYPQITIEMLKDQKPQFVLLSSEPYPFKEKHKVELQEALSDSKIILVNGEMFSWYGSRLINTPKYLNELKREIQG
ncbi:MAG: ABC transporter substrate-binding protein [Flavobacteriales bacterium]|nr:ABC transporter substrate-binding protein [Flavobacteriales bacterium]